MDEIEKFAALGRSTAPEGGVPLPPIRRYDAVSMTLHYFTLLLLIILFASIWMRGQASDGDTAALLLAIHRSTGSLIWLVTVGRLLWKRFGATAPALPPSVSAFQRWVARANEYALYLLLFAQPADGFGQSIARGKPFPLFGIDVPVMMERNKTLTHLLHDIHEVSATALLVLIGLHVLAAIFHALILRDGVLTTMLPGGRGSRRVA